MSVKARRLAKPQVLWTRDQDGHDYYSRELGWCLPLSGEPPDAYLSDSVQMLAERYGGAGVGTNGGGVRCGWFGGHQIKGIGQTCLAGRDMEYAHSYGGASLNAAIREAIWGEVFNAALPFGAVTSQALLATGTTVSTGAVDESPRKAARALTVRCEYLRPAHYLRSILFRPQAGFSAIYPTDTERTCAAVRSMRSGLTASLKPTNSTDVLDLLEESFRRFATQISVARAKRLVHSSLAASNIALDGRFLDFTGASSVPDHGRIIIAPGCPDAWQQHVYLLQCIEEILYYLQKYAGLRMDFSVAKQRLTSVFLNSLESRFNLELLKLSGIPERLIPFPSSPEATIASTVFRELIETGSEPFSFSSSCGAPVQMPEQMGKYRLGTCLCVAMDCDDVEEADRVLAPYIREPLLRSRFVSAVWWLRSLLPHNNEKSLDFARVNARRLNAPVTELHFHVLKENVDQVLADKKDVDFFIRQTVTRSIQFVRDPIAGVVQLSLNDNAILSADPHNGLRQNGEEVTWRQLRCSPLGRPFCRSGTT